MHVYGALTAHHDRDWLLDVVTRLTQRHEAALATPWSVSDAPAAYIEGQLRAIVGLRLSISRVEAKSKLSQNRSAADQDGVIDQLHAAGPGPAAVATAMRRVRTRSQAV